MRGWRVFFSLQLIENICSSVAKLAENEEEKESPDISCFRSLSSV